MIPILFKKQLFHIDRHVIILLLLFSQSESTGEDDGIFMKQFSADKLCDARSAAPLGELKYSVSCHKPSRRCVVTVIKAENLMQGHTEHDCNSYVKVYVLSDETIKKEQTDIVRGTRNPVFDHQISFTDVKYSSGTVVRLRVCNKSGSIKSKRCVIGDVALNLGSLALESGEEVKEWREIQEPELVSSLRAL